MNRRIRLADINGGQIGDFEEITVNDWRGVDFQRSAGICIYTWEMLITRLADLIGDGHVWTLQAGHEVPVSIDRAGNIWLDHEYLPPHKYLLLLVPRSVPA